MKRVRVIISGDVIGVGFRSWVLHKAKELTLSGFVKNREDDTVEVVAEGHKEALDALLAACNKGPDVAWVERTHVFWQQATGEFVGFEVVY